RERRWRFAGGVERRSGSARLGRWEAWVDSREGDGSSGAGISPATAESCHAEVGRVSSPIGTFWWRWKFPHRLNFGDGLTPSLVERLTGRRVIWSAPDRCELVGAGSVIQMILKRQGANHPRICGSRYILEDRSGEAHAQLDVLAVRGRSTLSRVDNLSPRSIALGDPGILAPVLLDSPVKKR